jgi:hypothetical protein
MNKEKAYDIAINGADFLASMIKSSGKFVYGFDHKTGERVKGYNILRHAGCIWALMDVAQTTRDSKIIAKCSDALKWMITERTKKFTRSSRMVVEKGYAKLGGAGLGALALCRYNSVRPNKDFFVIAKELCCYMALDCVTNKGKPKYLKRDVETGKDTGFFSDFYPGEAALALLEVDKYIHTTSRLKDSARSIIDYMYRYREKTRHVRDHWMLQAIESLRDPQFKEYAKKIAVETRENPISIKTGPTACRSEALLSYYDIVESKKVKKRILNHVEMLLDRQAKNQVKEGKNKGAFLWSHKDTTIRNDVCQHNISSFIRYFRKKS